MGRFINADDYMATGQGLLGNNMFSYCNNNPSNFTDSAGTRCVPATNKVLGGGTKNSAEEEENEDTILEKAIAWLSDMYGTVDAVHQQQLATQNNIILKQHEIVQDVAKKAWGTYNFSIELESKV